MKRNVIWPCLLALLSAGAIWFCLTAPGRGVSTRTTRTLSLITEIVNDTDLWDDEDTKRYGRLPDSGTNSVSLNRKVASAFKGCKDKAITSGRLVSSDGLFRDSWGEPLLFSPTNGTNYRRLNPELKGKPRPYVVWSSGPNRSNEYGYGDDLFSHL